MFHQSRYIQVVLSAPPKGLFFVRRVRGLTLILLLSIELFIYLLPVVRSRVVPRQSSALLIFCENHAVNLTWYKIY